MRRLRTAVKNFRISVQGVFHVPKTAKVGTVESVVFQREVRPKLAQFCRMEIISGASRHPKDVPFVREFWGIYGLGGISPRKKNLLIAMPSTTLCVEARRHGIIYGRPMS